MTAKISPYTFPGLPRKYSHSIYGKEPLEHITITDIVYRVCNRTGIPLEKIREHNRQRDVCDARHIIYYLADKHTRLSPAQITYHLHAGNHRTTIYNAIQKLRNLMQTDNTFMQMVNEMSDRLQDVSTERTLTQTKAA